MNTRHSRRLRRRAVRLMVAVIMTLGVVGLGGFLSVASATVPHVKGESVCNKDTGKFDVIWTISGDTGYPGETATIKTQSRVTNPSLVGKTVKDAGTTSGKEVGLDAGTYTQTVQVQWTNHAEGDLVSASGSVTAGGDCSLPATPPTVSASSEGCAKPGEEGVATISVHNNNSSGSVTYSVGFNGASQSVDLTVAAGGTGTAHFSAEPSTYDYGVSAKDGTYITGEVTIKECSDSTVIPVPSVPVIDKCGPDNAHYGEVPAGPYTVTRNADGSITLTANDGSTFPGGDKSVTLPAPKDSNQECPPPATGVSPTAPTSSDVCEPSSGATHDKLVVPSDENFTYTVNGVEKAAGSYPATLASYTVKAVPNDGVEVKEGAKTEWTFAFTKVGCKSTTPTPPSSPPANPTGSSGNTPFSANTGADGGYSPLLPIGAAAMLMVGLCLYLKPRKSGGVS